jgi:hypothetical protein
MRSTCARRRHAQIAFADTKHADFRIGSEFLAVAGFRWRCTDIGTRTIVAIRVDHGNSDWYQGPPYVAKEVVFDEAEMLECHRTIEEAIEAAVHEDETSGHPGYPAEVVSRMMEACSATRYPNDGVLRFDRCRPDGEILHAYAGRKEGNRWVLELYLPFCETFETMTEDAFIALPRATATDVRRRAGCVDRDFGED